MGKKRFLIIFGFFLTAVVSAGITYGAVKYNEISNISNDPFGKLRSTYQTIKTDYYKDAKTEDLVDGAIRGMLGALEDPYSTYMDTKEAKGFQENISSSFEGIGAEVQESDGAIMIVSPIKGSPAEAAGLKPKDKILKVDNTSVEGMSVNEAIMLIRGEKGSKVKLLVERSGVGELNFTITRDTIPIETVHFEKMDDGIGKIQITKFSESTDKELAKAVSELTKQNVKGFVIDLRQNPGGLLEQAVYMSDLFIAKGKNILQVENKDGSKEVYKAENEDKIDLPVVVVVDEGTASAAEIMAAALHQSAGIPIIGDKTFGKGTIQTTKAFKDGSSVKYTIAKWLTPDGHWIHEKGIKPQYAVSLPEYAKLPYLDPEKTLKEEDSSAEVKVAQQMLQALGYNNVKANGIFDPATKQEVEKFQKENGIAVNGQIGGETTIKMIESLQKKLIENDTQLEEAVNVLKKQLAS
ncbi:S41 family peptidase [Metabacillus fastidiosus]|uniref:S41 family peptidase n=1 Tax=Metabacillus fastidiosus TaxID=1458 RepID=A0ABU6NTZ6_9BACI|nr:S41 family peptidase [Metabacillus fastidiosus]MED4400173.1 S41 family peptidase [Metabacillus fastidiosus]